MNKIKKTKTIIITGPTATGKTTLAVNLARRFNGEIISADSRQVYRGLDIGTGKDIEEYGTGDNAVKYHLIDILSPNDEYNLKQFNTDAKRLINEIQGRDKLPIIAGGTALYVDSLVSDYDFPISAPDSNVRAKFRTKSAEELADYLKTTYPEIYNKLENKNSQPRLLRAIEDAVSQESQNRLQATGIGHQKDQESNIEHLSAVASAKEGRTSNKNFEWLIIGTFFPRKEVHARIEKRLEERLDSGMIEEVKSLHKNGVSWERLDAFGLEYRYISKYLKEEISLEEMKSTLLAKIRRLARSQDIWFRKMEKKGHKFYWIPEGEIKQASSLIRDFLDDKKLPEPKIKLMDIFYGPKS